MTSSRRLSRLENWPTENVLLNLILLSAATAVLMGIISVEMGAPKLVQVIVVQTMFMGGFVALLWLITDSGDGA